MGDWPSWWAIGVDVGFGVALGIFFAAVAGSRRSLYVAAIVLAAGCAAAIGFLVWQWDEAVGGIAGGVLGVVAADQVVAGALRRGATRLGLTLLVGGVAILVAALALIPVVGYLEAVVLPALSLRLRRRAPERYAGLRTLARD